MDDSIWQSQIIVVVFLQLFYVNSPCVMPQWPLLQEVMRYNGRDDPMLRGILMHYNQGEKTHKESYALEQQLFMH